MKLLTKRIREKLIENHHLQLLAQSEGREWDPYPVLKVFNPGGPGTWLFTELSEFVVDETGEEQGVLFGLCDPGHGHPDLGTVFLSELRSFRNHMGLPLERDQHFRPVCPLSVYVDHATEDRIIRTNPLRPLMIRSDHPMKGEDLEPPDPEEEYFNNLPDTPETPGGDAKSLYYL